MSGRQYVSIHEGWVTRTSASLAALGKQHDRMVVVTNASANGRTTRQALELIDYEVQSQSPDLVILQFGMNDCNYWKSDRGLPRVSRGGFEANLQEIVARALNFGARRVLLNTNHPTGLDRDELPGVGITYQQSNERYNEVIRHVVTLSDERVSLNDIERTFREHAGGDRARLEELLMPAPDLLHLSALGHDLYYRLINPVLEAFVLELLGDDQ